MKKIATLKVQIKTNWGLLEKGTVVEILDDNTPIHQSYRVRPVDALENQIFGVDKTFAAGFLDFIDQ